MNKVVLVVLGIFSFSIFAQNTPSSKPNDRQIIQGSVKDSILFKGADAVVLKEEGVVEYEFSEESGFSILQKVKRLIQINTKDGISHASLLIPFYSNRYTKEVVEVDSYKIYRMIQGKEEVIAVNMATNRKVNDDFYIKEIIVDDIRVGDRIEYSYTKKLDNIDVIPTWYFQEDIPKIQSSYTVIIPDNLTYIMTKNGSLNLIETKEITQTARNLAGSNWGTSYRFKEAILRFNAKQIPAFQQETFMENVQNNISSIRFDLIQFQYPMNPSVVIPHEPMEVAKEIYKNKNFGSELRQEKFWKKTLEPLVFDGLNATEKAEKVIAFVQSTIKWNNQYAYETDKGVKKAMSQGIGNSADINLALIGALRAAGFSSEPIVLSTQSNGQAPLLFSRFLNQVIAGVQIDDQFFVVDGASDQAVLNVLPFEDLNGYGWMITDKFAVTKVDLTPKQLSFRQEDFQLILDESGHVSGQMKSILTRYEALAFQSKYAESTLNRSRAAIETRSTQFFLSQGEITPNKNKDIELQFQVQKFNFATLDSQKQTLTFNPLEFYRDKENPFENLIRQSDVYFTYPFLDMYKVMIQLPAGYKIQSLPVDEVFTSAKVGAQMQYEVKVLDPDKLQVGLSLRMQKTKISQEDYQELRLLYKHIFQKLTEMNVVLEKK